MEQPKKLQQQIRRNVIILHLSDSISWALSVHFISWLKVFQYPFLPCGPRKAKRNRDKQLRQSKEPCYAILPPKSAQTLKDFIPKHASLGDYWDLPRGGGRARQPEPVAAQQRRPEDQAAGQGQGKTGYCFSFMKQICLSLT